MTYDEQIEIITAAKAGKVIQTEHSEGWIDVDDGGCFIPFDFQHRRYRVKPEPLKKLRIPNSKACVVMLDGKPHYAVRYDSSNNDGRKVYKVHTDAYWAPQSFEYLKELTREQCEAAGYAYPEQVT